MKPRCWVQKKRLGMKEIAGGPNKNEGSEKDENIFFCAALAVLHPCPVIS